MRLVTFQSPTGAEHPGALLADGQRVVDLSTEFASLQALIEAGEPGLDRARKLCELAERVHRLDEVRLLAPLPRPPRMRCFSVYEKHMTQAIEAVVRSRGGNVAVALNKVVGFIKVPKDFYRAPAYYKGNTSSVIGPEDEVPWPTFPETKMDYELELGLVIGRPGQDILAESAREHVFGYTVYNDFSARDRLLQEISSPLGPRKGKDFEGGNAIGPWIVTADEIPDPSNLRMEVRVNGESRGVCHTAEMYHSIDAMIAEASLGERVVAGEFFGTGAGAGGTGIEQWRFLEPGDTVELEIEKIGVLRNRIGARRE